MDAYQLLVLIIFIISCIEFVVSAIGYYLFRNVQPFKARSQGLLWPLLLCLMANQIKYYLILSEQNNCIADIWIEGKRTSFHDNLYIIFTTTFKNLTVSLFSGQVSDMTDIFKLGIFGNATVFIYFVRAFRLLVIFNVTEKRFEEETLPKEEIANKKKVSIAHFLRYLISVSYRVASEFGKERNLCKKSILLDFLLVLLVSLSYSL